MLTADLVNARRRGRDLVLVRMDESARTRACAIAATLIEAASLHVGATRDELLDALGAVDIAPREHRLRDGLAKLVEDRCVFEMDEELDASVLRREVFMRASEVRTSLAPTVRFSRMAVLEEVARTRETSPEAIERGLFSDLRGAHAVIGFDTLSAEQLVTIYERAQAQAVLLRAVKVTLDVQCASPRALRALFRRLRFLRLLHTILPMEAGYRIVIDGPFSLFDSVTKYGLKLALVIPALDLCDTWHLMADVRWGKERAPLTFRLSGSAALGGGEESLPEEVATLVRAFDALATRWKVRTNTDILDLPGVGLSVPDLVFEHHVPGVPPACVYLEVMGYWSRDAVWRRVEMVRAGFPHRILFAVSAHLRVSEEVLDDAPSGALYVYKRTMNARTLVERLNRLVDNASGVTSPSGSS